MKNIAVESRVEGIRFGGSGGEEVNVPWAVATHPEGDRVSDQLLVVAPGLLTSPGMPKKLARSFAEASGLDTIAFRSEYGQLEDPVRQVPERGALIANRLIARRMSEQDDYQDRVNLVAQSAGGIIAPTLLRQGGVNAYVALSTIGVTVRDRLALPDYSQEAVDEIPFEHRAEAIYKLEDEQGNTGEDRMSEVWWGFVRNCATESLHMNFGREVGALASANRGVYLDLVRNLRRSDPRRGELSGSGMLRRLRQSRVAEAFRLAANADSWPEFEAAQAEGTKIGGVFGTTDPIVPFEDAEKAKHRFDAFRSVEGVGHPFMTSRRARETNRAAAEMVVQLSNPPEVDPEISEEAA